MPQLIWNMMMSMSGGWFFVVASEAISVGNTTVTLPGVGSYIALAIEHAIWRAVGWAIGAMLMVILIYDQLLFRPLVAWADRFRFEQEAGGMPPRSWVLTCCAVRAWSTALTEPFAVLWRLSLRPRRTDTAFAGARRPRVATTAGSDIWFGVLAVAVAAYLRCGASHDSLSARSRSPMSARVLLGLATLDARGRADRDRQRHLGADRRLGRHAAARRQHGAAGGAVPGRVPGQPAVSDRRSR